MTPEETLQQLSVQRADLMEQIQAIDDEASRVIYDDLTITQVYTMPASTILAWEHVIRKH